MSVHLCNQVFCYGMMYILHASTYLVVITDLFSKWVGSISCEGNGYRNFGDTYGNVPHYIHSDQGANLTSNLMAAICRCLGIEQTHTSAYHPQGNGQVERFNRTLESMLAMVVNDHQTDWDLHLPRVLFAYHTAIHDATGFSPFHITFSRSPTIPVDTMMGTLPQQPSKSVPAFWMTCIAPCILLTIL